MSLTLLAVRSLGSPRARTARSSTCRRIGLVLLTLIPTAGLRAQSDYATQYTFTTLAGTADQYGSADGTGSAARFDQPFGVAVDHSGNIYVADTENFTIRKVTSAGVVTTFAGTVDVPGSADGTGTAAQFGRPFGVAIDSDGNLYVADAGNQTVRRITSAGVVTTLAGMAGASGSDDGTGSAARFGYPCGVAVDASGNVYITDKSNDTIRKITPAGVVTTIAGSAGVPGSSNGVGDAALFNNPEGIAVDGSGNIYVADTFNDAIRMITSGGVVTTLAGTAGVPGSADGAAASARFATPNDLALDESGNLYVADSGNDTIRMIANRAVVTTLAGTPGVGGSSDGTGSAALFFNPQGIAVDGAGNLYVTDGLNDTIRKGQPSPPTLPEITTQPVSTSVNLGAISTFSVNAAGVPLPSYQWQLNGADISASATNVTGATGPTLTIASTQLADAGTYTVVVTNASGSATSVPATLTVTQPITFSTSILKSVPTGPSSVCVDPSGNIFFFAGNALERATPAGGLAFVAGNLIATGSADGTGAAASFNAPTGLAADGLGNIYVADTGNNSIRRVTPEGVVTTLAGLVLGNADGVGLAAEFDKPTAVAVDGAGNVYVADAGNNELRKIAPDGSTTTVLSASSFTFANMGQPTGTSYSIKGVAVGGGAVYVGVAVEVAGGTVIFHQFSASVLKLTGSGTYTGVFQVADPETEDDFALPGDGSLTVDGNGNIYVLAGLGLFQGPNLIATLIDQGVSTLPVAIAAGPHGVIYVAAPGISAIEVVTPVGSVPDITAEPTGGTIAYGAEITLSAAASATPAPAYQWQVNGVNIAGATSSSYVTSVPGTYTVVATNAAGAVTSSAAVVTAATRLANISSRAFVGTGADVAIAGFVVSGPPGSTEQVLVRGAGPSLSQFAVGGFLAQPVLTLFNAAGDQVATNTGWNTASNAAAIAASFTATGAFAFSLDSADSALLVSLPPGAYTAEISGLNGTTGVALAEVYEVASGSPELINISTRAFVGTGTSVEIGGFIVTGSQPAKVLVRAIGPSLSTFGVSGVLAQPSLSVVDASGATVATNTGWSTNANVAAITAEMAAVGAFALPSGSQDCVLLLSLPPGAYTAVVSGVNATSGVALVEVYEAP